MLMHTFHCTMRATVTLWSSQTHWLPCEPSDKQDLDDKSRIVQHLMIIVQKGKSERGLQIVIFWKKQSMKQWRMCKYLSPTSPPLRPCSALILFLYYGFSLLFRKTKSCTHLNWKSFQSSFFLFENSHTFDTVKFRSWRIQSSQIRLYLTVLKLFHNKISPDVCHKLLMENRICSLVVTSVLQFQKSVFAL